MLTALLLRRDARTVVASVGKRSEDLLGGVAVREPNRKPLPIVRVLPRGGPRLDDPTLEVEAPILTERDVGNALMVLAEPVKLLGDIGGGSSALHRSDSSGGRRTAGVDNHAGPMVADSS